MKTRLDQLLFENGTAGSREKAKAMIMAGDVYVDGVKQTKPGMTVSDSAVIEYRGGKLPFVSRGGYKLQKALDEFRIDPTGTVCLDCGASTGGFTDCLLQRGARRVYAVDVGYGQLAWSLRNDDRVTVMERTNARYLTTDMFPERMDLAVMDLAFISVRLVIPAVLPLLHESGQMICLIKPQFEAGREKVGKKGVVRDPAVHLDVLEKFDEALPGYGLSLAGAAYSPIRGPEGNIEYLVWLRQSGERADIDLKSVVEQSHAELEKGGTL